MQKLKNNKKLKKSQILLLGSLLVFIGVIFISSNYLGRIKEEIFNDMRVLILGDSTTSEEVTIPGVDNVTEETVNTQPSSNNNSSASKPVDYSKYYGVLEIPKIGMKRGFYKLGHKYNDINYNVTMVEGSTMPDVDDGNLILMAHSGDSYISFFAYLHRLNVGDYAYITYKNKKYKYNIVKIYDVPKNGVVSIVRNYDRTTLTLITCTNNDDNSQTVYIAELV